MRTIWWRRFFVTLLIQDRYALLTGNVVAHGDPMPLIAEVFSQNRKQRRERLAGRDRYRGCGLLK
jgi:hypothetical protein